MDSRGVAVFDGGDSTELQYIGQPRFQAFKTYPTRRLIEIHEVCSVFCQKLVGYLAKALLNW